jgi:hypothetical protein
MPQTEHLYYPLQKLPERYRPVILVRPGDERVEESFIAPDEYAEICGQALGVVRAVRHGARFRTWQTTIAPQGSECWTAQLSTPDRRDRLDWSTFKIAYNLGKDALELRREEFNSNSRGYRIDNFKLELQGPLARATDLSIQADKSHDNTSFEVVPPDEALTVTDWQTYMQEKIEDDMVQPEVSGRLGRIRSWFRGLEAS